jgi:predicted amidohydrolase YtcJ
VQAAVKQHKPGEWILGRAWDQNLWPSKQFPGLAALSGAVPNNPVSLERVDGHALWVNRKALELADINPQTPDPPGGKILRNAKGAPTGVLIDRAQNLINSRIPRPSQAQIEARLLRATQDLARLGITTVHDAGVPFEDIEGYRSLIRKGLRRFACTP